MLILYDIPSTIPGSAWSPNTWKTRYCLNYKGIPYKTEWVEYPDIEGHCKKLGIAPTATKRNGTPHYTLPAIFDPSSGALISDSFNIAKYLDKAYPDTPRIIPPGTEALQIAFVTAHESGLDPLWASVLPRTNMCLNPRSEEYFRRTREPIFGGQKLEDVIPRGKDHEDAWKKLEQGYNTFYGWLKMNESGDSYVMGNTLSFADFQIAGFLLWTKLIFGEDSVEWKHTTSWNDGKWKIFMEGMKKYETIV